MHVVRRGWGDTRWKIKTPPLKTSPLPDTSNMRRVEILAADAFATLLEELKKLMQLMNLQTWPTPFKYHVCSFFWWQILLRGIARFTAVGGTHHWWDSFLGKFRHFFSKTGLDMERVCMLETDAAPSLAGKVSGLSARWSAVAPQMMFLHCIVRKTMRGVEDDNGQRDGYNQFHPFHIKPPTSFILQATVRHVCWAPPPAFVQRRHVDLRLERFCELMDEMASFLRSSKHKRQKYIWSPYQTTTLWPMSAFWGTPSNTWMIQTWDYKAETKLSPGTDARISSQTGPFRKWLEHGSAHRGDGVCQRLGA